MTPQTSTLSSSRSASHRRLKRDRAKALAANQAALQASVLADDDALLMKATTLAWSGLKSTTFYAMIAAGTFPRPKKIGSSSRWRAGEVRAWLTAQAAK